MALPIASSLVPTLAQFLEMRTALPTSFSPDGERLLVQSNLTGTMQLYGVPRAGGELEQLTDFTDPVSGAYLPARNQILLQSDVGGNERLQLSLFDPETRESTPLAHDPDYIHRYGGATRDGSTIAYGCNKRNGVDFDVYVRGVDGGDERMVFSQGGWCEPAGFSPDGAWVAVERLTEKSGDNDLYLVPVDGGEPLHVSPHDDEAVFGAPAWLADGSAFYFATSTGRDTAAIARYDFAARTWEYVIESDWDLDCQTDRAGRHLLVAANEDGYSRLELRDPRTLEVTAQVPLPGRGVVAATTFSADGRYLAFHFTSPTLPGDVWVHDTESGESRRLTHSPGEVGAEEMVEPELVRFPSFDGESIPAFVLTPKTGEGPFPVIVYIHGGPEGQSQPLFIPMLQYFASSGYAVAVPNVRGSTGYGKRYEHLDDVRLRMDSVRDLLGLHDWLAADPRFDESKVVLYGGSYGGYMVLAGLAFFPDRWAGGVDVVGISNLVTFLENTSEWRRAFREREYGTLERDREFLLSVSPITRVDDIRAPLLIIHGANDPRVPLSEAEQIHAALESRGVASELLVYHDEGHGLHKLKNRLDAYPRAVAFLDEVLGR
jgi:dipeptidyl aminopeptidase/acylaminoacyl peptidase